MAADDLSTPLGVGRPDEPPPPRFSVGQISLAVTGVVVAALAGWIALKADPFGGEPHAVAKIDRTLQTSGTPAATAAPAVEVARTDAPGQKARETASEMEDSSGVKVFRGKSGTAPGAVVIRVPDAPAASGKLQPAPDRRLVEKGRHGPLPKIGGDGAKPRDIYARPFEASRIQGRPVISIIVTGLGIGVGVTGDAISKLPPDVTLAFAPYGTDLEKQAARAREEGHELLLQLPMEPFDYPDNDPGPQTLLAEAGEEQNLDRLFWLMSRVQGYVGLTNFMGGKFSGSRAALKPVLAEAAKRGLMLLDDGSSGRSQMLPAAAAAGLPALKGDVVLDGIEKAGDIDAALAKAEAAARANGRAIVVGPALPLTIDRLNRWARALEQRGIVLVPVSAQMQPARS